MRVRARRRSAALGQSESNRSGVDLKVPDQPTLDLVGKGQAGETDDLAPQVLVAQAVDEASHALRVGVERVPHTATSIRTSEDAT